MVRDDAIEREVEQWPAGAAARTRRAAESRRSSLSSPQRPDRSFTVVRRDRWLPVVVGRRMPRVASTTGMKGCARGTSLLTRLAGPPERLRTNPDHPANCYDKDGEYPSVVPGDVAGGQVVTEAWAVDQLLERGEGLLAKTQMAQAQNGMHADGAIFHGPARRKAAVFG